mgnify:CR=1 FL=1
MKRIVTLLAAAAMSVAAWAQPADGEVKKIDKAQGKVTLKHGEIKNLDMPPMTMVFQVKEGVMLDKLKAGDRIRFVAEKSATGYVVTDVRPVP